MKKLQTNIQLQEKAVHLNLPGFFYWKDKKGTYQKISENFMELLGMHDIIGKNDAALWPLDADVILKNDSEILAGKTESFEEKITGNFGTKYFIVNKMPWRDSANNIIGVIANLTDITSLKEREFELEISRNSMAANIENVVLCSPGSIYWKDRNGVYLGCNDFMVKDAGLTSRSDIIGKTDEELWPKQAKRIRENDLEVMQTGKTVSSEEMVIDRYYFSMKMPLRDSDNNIIGVICNSHDITYLKEVEAQLRKAKERSEAANQAKSEFLAIVSHELRSPLTSILGMIHFLKVKPNLTVEDRKEYLDNISIAANHLLSLVNDFLDFSKLEAGKFELTVGPVNFKQLISETVTIFMPQAIVKGLELIVDYEHMVPHMILGDSRALRQILINLLSNAIKFTDTGFIMVKVECSDTGSENIELVLSVTDTGIGIPEEKIPIIFDDFQQVDTSYRRNFSGTGLGLTITKKLISIMDGKLEVFSQKNKGSTFKCTLGLAYQNTPILEHPWRLYQAVPILIVDDSQRGDIIRKQIGSSNCQVVNSRDALNIYIVNQQYSIPFSIVIIDDQLREENANELAEKIAGCPNLEKPMMVLISGTPLGKAKKLRENSVFFECIAKPVQPLELQTALTAAWERWSEQRDSKSNPKILPNQSDCSSAGTSQEYSGQDRMDEIFGKKDNAGKKKVLLIDDEKTVLMVHRELLKDLGCIVEAINDGHLALKRLESDEHYDVIFLDMGIPEISGYDLVKRRRIKEKENKIHTPLIALTGFSSEKDKSTFREAGVDEILIKPVTPEQLENTLKKYST